MVSVFGHLGCDSNVGFSEVSHFLPVLFCCLGVVEKLILNSNQVFFSLSALSRHFLELSEVGLSFNEIFLKGRPGFFVFLSPHPTIFQILAGLDDQTIHYADDLGLSDRLVHSCCKVCTILPSGSSALFRERIFSSLDAMSVADMWEYF